MACRSRRICWRATSPQQTGDITYVATAEGWLFPKGTSFGAYLAVVTDPFRRQVVGWSMHPHMRAESGIELCQPHDVREELGRNSVMESGLTVFIM
jgi:hypothetical protein